MISVELKHLAHLLNDVQDQSHESPEIAIDFDVVLLICDLVTLIRRHIAKTICLEVKASQPFMVHLPENTLRQVILNLLLNAAEAIDNKASGHIYIRIYQSALGLAIQVLDDGAGFSQEMLDYGLHPFRTNCQRNTGSGFTMAQKVLKNIGGSIKLSNQIPHGACVTLLLPRDCNVRIF